MRLSGYTGKPMRDVSYELEGTHFVWDTVKYKNNYSKHKIAFEEAATVIINPTTEYYEDKAHSDYEERLIAVGYSDKLRELVVCHCLREDDFVIRIISARKASKSEKQKF